MRTASILSPTRRGGTLAVVTALVMWATALNAKATSEQEAHAIGVDAYVYLYPLVTMDVTRRQFTNIEPGKELGKGPMNMFNNVPEYPPANFKSVVRPNFDTLYSIAYLDMTKEPVVVTVPDSGGRYYLLPMLDMWTDVFAVVGTRTTGGTARQFAIAAPGASAPKSSAAASPFASRGIGPGEPTSRD